MPLPVQLTRAALIGALLVGVTACSNIKPTEDNLKILAETNIGEPVKNISNVRSDSSQTYYTARTASGDYNCSVPSGASGGLYTVASFGMMRPAAMCQPKGARGPQHPLLRQ